MIALGPEDLHRLLEDEICREDLSRAYPVIFGDAFARFGRRLSAVAPHRLNGDVTSEGDYRFVVAYNLLPSVFFAALMHRAALYLKDFALADRWNALFEEAIADHERVRP